MRGVRFAALKEWSLGCFLGLGYGFGFRLRFLLCPGLGCELLLDLGSDGVGIDLVHGSRVTQHIRSVMA
jgi:hypothetical protein